MVVAVYSCVCLLFGCLLLSADEMPETETVEEWKRIDLPLDADFKMTQATIWPTIQSSTLVSFNTPPLFIEEDVDALAKHKLSFNPEFSGSISPDVHGVFFPTTIQSTVAPKDPAAVVEALCHLDRMYVRVLKNAVKDPKAWQSLYFGSCPVNQAKKAHYYFLYALHRCGLHPRVTDDAIVFTQLLRYAPNTTDVVIRTRPFAVPVSCKFSRFHRTYKIGFHPIVGDVYFKSLQTIAGASLTAVNANWIPLGPGEYYELEDAMYFEVKVPIGDNQRAFVNRCHITASGDSNAIPRFIVIDNFGCMVDSMSSSLSRYHRYPDRAVLRFTIGSFLFPNMDLQQGLFIHCDVTYGTDSTPSGKACTFNRNTYMWDELYGDFRACFCCNTTCPGSQGTANGHKMTSSESWKMGTGQEILQVTQVDDADDDDDDDDDYDDSFPSKWNLD